MNGGQFVPFLYNGTPEVGDVGAHPFCAFLEVRV